MTGRRRVAAKPGLFPARADMPCVVVVPGDVATATVLCEHDVEALILPVAPSIDDDDEDEVQPRTGTAEAAARYGIDLADLAARVDADGIAGSAHTVHLPRVLGDRQPPWDGLPDCIVLVGVGAGAPADLRRAGAAIARATRGMRRVVTTVGAASGPSATHALVEGYLLGAYQHPSCATGTPPLAPAEALVLLGDHGSVDGAMNAAAATWTARGLAATPSSTKSPEWLAEQAVTAARAAGLEAAVLGPTELDELGFGGLLAVGSGSASSPRLVVVRYTPNGQEHPQRVVVVGKGITFDTGGLSLKSRESMVTMKTDMTGAAVALAIVLGAAAMGVTQQVTAVLPLAENAIGGSSYRPGDVVKIYGGVTVEVGNTDAEGRLVLADALAYADAELDPDLLIDVATLTGAATVGLGRQHGALFTADDDLADALVAAGQAAGEQLWRLPLVADYRPSIDSTIADVRQMPDPAVSAGAITAALFLQRFVGSRRWAHLDIAGPARAVSSTHEIPQGATGFGARVVLRLLTDS